MPVRDPQAVLQKLAQTTLKVDGYFLQRTGFVSNQTVLKLGEYSLNCVPATIGIEESRLLAVLSPGEQAHFLKFKGGTQILLLAFDSAERRDIMRFPVRVTFVDLVPIPDRKNVCFLVVKAKSFPSEFILFLGDFLEELEGRREAWETSGTELIPITAGPTSLDPNAVVVCGEQKLSVQVSAFRTQLISLVWSPEPGPLAENSVVHLRLNVRNHPMVLEGHLGAEGNFIPEFHPEWLSFIEDYLFQNSLKSRGSQRQTP